MTNERINSIMQYFDRNFLCKPYSETSRRSSIDNNSAYPELPEYKQTFPTIGVDWGSDISKEMNLLQGYAFAKREMEAKQNQQRVGYVNPHNRAQIIHYIEEDIKQTTKLCKEMLNMKYGTCFGIAKVVFNNPATIVFWADGTKTVVKAGKGDRFDPEKGLAMAIAKRALGNEGNYYNVFREHLPKTKVVKSTANRKKAGKKTTADRKKTAKKTTEDKAMDLAVANGLVVDTNTGEKFVAEPKLTKTPRRTKKEG